MDRDGDGSASGSFQDIRGNNNYKARYSISYSCSLFSFIILFVQAGYVDGERDCCSRQYGDFDAGSTLTDGRKVYKWRRDIFKGSQYEESH